MGASNTIDAGVAAVGNAKAAASAGTAAAFFRLMLLVFSCFFVLVGYSGWVAQYCLGVFHVFSGSEECAEL